MNRRQHREHSHKLFSTAAAIIAVAVIFAVASFGGLQLTGYAVAKAPAKEIVVSPYAANVRVDALLQQDGNVVAVDGAAPLVVYFNAPQGKKIVEVGGYAADGPVEVTLSVVGSGAVCSKTITSVATISCNLEGTDAGEIAVQLFAQNALLKVDAVRLKVE